jgi:hypothetical protein
MLAVCESFSLAASRPYSSSQGTEEPKAETYRSAHASR